LIYSKEAALNVTSKISLKEKWTIYRNHSRILFSKKQYRYVRIRNIYKK